MLSLKDEEKAYVIGESLVTQKELFLKGVTLGGIWLDFETTERFYGWDGKNWRSHGDSNPGFRRERPVS